MFFATSTEALPLAAVAAAKLESELCPTVCHVKFERKGLVTAHYYSRKQGEIRFITIPKSRLQPERKALIAEALVSDIDKLAAITSLMKKFKVKTAALIAVASICEEKEIEKLGVEKI